MTSNLNNLDKVTKVILKPCPEMIVKHVVQFKRRGKGDKIYDFAFEYGINGSNKNDGIRFETDDAIVLESSKYYKNTTPESPPINAYISYMEAPFVISCLDNALTWLQGEHNREIFISSPEGIPIKLGTTVRAVVPITNNRFISFQPTIISDGDMTYQGIKIKCELGEIGSLTAQEFLQFALAIKYVLMNLYATSVNLTTLGLIYYINKKNSGGNNT
jgi:hypothetical protein